MGEKEKLEASNMAGHLKMPAPVVMESPIWTVLLRGKFYWKLLKMVDNQSGKTSSDTCEVSLEQTFTLSQTKCVEAVMQLLSKTTHVSDFTGEANGGVKLKVVNFGAKGTSKTTHIVNTELFNKMTTKGTITWSVSSTKKEKVIMHVAAGERKALYQLVMDVPGIVTDFTVHAIVCGSKEEMENALPALDEIIVEVQVTHQWRNFLGKWAFGRIRANGKREPICSFELLSDGTVFGATHHNEKKWRYHKGCLEFINSKTGKVTTRFTEKSFDKKTQLPTLKGRYVGEFKSKGMKNEKLLHYLRRP